MLKITKQIREFITSNTNLSANARLLYLLLADRAELSEKNKENFSDEHGIFIYFTVAEVQTVLGCSKHTALKTLDELEYNGFICRRHTQKADKIYILQSAKIAPCGVQKLHSAECKNCTLQSAKIAPNQKSNNQNPNNQKLSSSSSSPNPPLSKEKIMDQIEYSKMIEEDTDSKPVLDMLVDLLVEKNDDEITSAHIKHIITSVKKQSKRIDIVNIKAYLLSCLKNVKADVAVRSSTPAGSVEPDPESDWEQLKRLSVVDEVP